MLPCDRHCDNLCASFILHSLYFTTTYREDAPTLPMLAHEETVFVCQGFPTKSEWLEITETRPSLLGGSRATLSVGSREESVLCLSH